MSPALIKVSGFQFEHVAFALCCVAKYVIVSCDGCVPMHNNSKTTLLAPSNMDELVLTLAVRFLGAKDAFAASCVSKRWRVLLAGDCNNGSLWKQVFTNSFVTKIRVPEKKRKSSSIELPDGAFETD